VVGGCSGYKAAKEEKMKLILFTIAALTAIVACGEASMVALVRSEVKRLEHDRNVKIEVEKAPIVTLPGLELYHAAVLVPDHPGYRCAAHAKEVWCSGDQPLGKVVKAFSLGSKPEQLDDAAWIRLCTFLIPGAPLDSADKADLLEDYVSAEAKAKIRPPKVERGQDGVKISYYVERVIYMSYPSGPMSLEELTISVTPENEVAVTTRVVWPK
jgi:hypothetical protein